MRAVRDNGPYPNPAPCPAIAGCDSNLISENQFNGVVPVNRQFFRLVDWLSLRSQVSRYGNERPGRGRCKRE